MGFFKRSRSGGSAPEIEVALFSGDVPLEVVGESFYQENLRLVLERLGREVAAILLPDPTNQHDANAVAVIVGGIQVGFLSRNDAARYQPAIQRLATSEGKPIAVEGRIVGGESDKPTLGIWLSHDPADFGLPAASGTTTLPSRSERAELAADGQPYEARFNRARRAERDISELLGLCKGFLADGELTDSEIRTLHGWFDRHSDGTEDWIVAQVMRRVRSILEDGIVSNEERSELTQLLSAFTGGTTELVLGEDPRSTALPLNSPAPDLDLPGAVFVFTGKFAFGPRADCERATMRLGGSAERDVTKRTRYLVIGTFGSRDWVHTAYGRKIQKAAEYRESGVPVAIICEDHWRKWLE